VFGVGYDVNTLLLDQLSEQNNGVSVYVSPDENIEIAVSNFYQKSACGTVRLCPGFGTIAVDEQFPDAFRICSRFTAGTAGRYLTTGQETVTCLELQW